MNDIPNPSCGQLSKRERELRAEGFTPTREQPGTLREQFLAVGIYLADPLSEYDGDGAWDFARRSTMPHAGGEA